MLSADRALGDYFDALLALGIEPRSAANWIQGEVRRYLTEREISIVELPVRPEGLAELIRAVQAETLSLSKAKDVFRRMLADGASATQIIAEQGLGQTADVDELRQTLQGLLERFPDERDRYRAGKKNLFGFFMGEAMKASGGKANPKLLNSLLSDLLNAS